MARIRLRSLKLNGFKSFPEDVELVFPGKVSAIIGPNGCGKSNLVDAILWVLGEQSPSQMRLKQMGDVVFSGASGRPPAGAAEVTLVLESDDGHWKETDGRLEVRRRVFRSGPSEYRLNGRNVRLKDVFDELAAVGLGTRAYSIIEQGRVGQVLSARPIDRRTLLEEAAGITRYKKRKHEAELKLEHTRQNLLRLDDVIGEVKRNLRQIKRQAKQAERHQKLEADLKDHLRRLFTIEAHILDRQRGNILQRRAQAQNEVAAAAAALGGSDADLGRAREELESARSDTEKAREEVATLLGSRERLEAFLERSADLLDNLRASLDHTRNETATLRSSRGSL
ncbi:MAG: AAA family ATPase, partial [Acidobacteriota bacterium]